MLGFDGAAQRYMIELERHSSWDQQAVQLKIKAVNLLLQAESAVDCAICLCEAVRPVRLANCQHTFCSARISRLRSHALQDERMQDTCPLCRAAIGDDAQKHWLEGAIEWPVWRESGRATRII